MSRLPFELLLALRYLRPRRTFVSVITLISIIGVMLGVAVLIIVISVMSGFDRQLRDRILGFSAHVRVMGGDGPIADWPSVASAIRSEGEVVAVAPFVFGQVLLKTQPAEGEGSPRVLAPVVRGVDTKLESTVSRLPASVTEGEKDFAAALRGRGMLVGRTIADKLGLRVGDSVAVYSISQFERMEQARKRGREEAPLADDYTITGIFDAGYYEFNDLFVLVSLANAQDMYALDSAVTGMNVLLKDPERARDVAFALREKLDDHLRISTWLQENAAFLEALVVEKSMMYYLLFFIVLVAAFGIMSALITFVVQKTREIGMLKALGSTRAQVVWIFLSQSLTVGVLGVLAGLGLGLLAVTYRNQFLYVMRRATGFELFPESVYGFRDLPALVRPSDIVVICVGSLLLCVLAGLLPAWTAGRLKPVEALRHE